MPLEVDYWNISGHVPMLRDEVRCESFRRALADTVTPGCAVLDIGAGTGILSLFAAQAGARVVYAVERTSMARLARRIVASNGMQDRIQVLEEEMEELSLPEPVDIIVSEWLGGYGIDENLLPMVVQARDRWLKPGGIMIPQAVSVWMAPALDTFLREDMEFWTSRLYGIDFQEIGQALARQLDWGCHHIRPEHLLGEPQMLWDVDPRTCSLRRAGEPFTARLTFVAERPGSFNTLAAWFRAELDAHTVLGNGPGEPDTHWGRSVFPVGRILSVQPGDKIEVSFVLEPQGKGRSKAVWEVQFGDYRFHSEGITVLTAGKAGTSTGSSINP